MTIQYSSTRGQAPALSFRDAVLTGLASDGGLYLPDSIPQLRYEDFTQLRGASYAEVAYAIISRFITDGSIETSKLKEILDDSYATFCHKTSFRHKDVAPLRKLHDETYLLELFHGPTLAFKDFALQFLGRLLGHYFSQTGGHATILGATSGDTGSAAIAGFAGRPDMDIFILHPHERISDVQRKQMTTVPDTNIHNIAIEGSFDDCQDIVKTLFSDAGFRRQHTLVAINSINWARILAQVVYYVYAALKLGAPEKKVTFCVPTGNFGDIYAGYIAKKMGLPMGKLIIATNENNILKRTLDTGVYSMDGVFPTLSPSMDIQISSNFERLLFDLHGKNAALIADKMTRFRQERKLELSPEAHARFKNEFSAGCANDDETLATIKAVQEKTGALLDPHTAVGYTVVSRHQSDDPMVVLATAHPAKFPDAVKKATGIHPDIPEHMRDIFDKKERYDVQPADANAIKKFIKAHST